MQQNIYKQTMMNQNEFLNQFKEALELESEIEINLSDSFKELDEWDSLAQLSLTAMLDEEYDVELESDDLAKLDTVEDLFLFVKSRH